MSQKLINQGLEAAQSGNIPLAQNLLAQAVRQTPDSAQAWYWLGMVLEDAQKKKYCLDRALQLDPTLASPPVSPAPATQPKTEAKTPSAAQPEQPPVRSAPPPLRAAAKRPPARASKISRPVLISIIAGSVLLSGCVIALLFSAFSLKNHKEQVVLNQANVRQPTYTLRVLPTLIPSRTPTPKITRTPSPTPSQTPTLNPTDLYQHLGFQITSARMALDSDLGEECIRAYDRLLSEMPEWPTGYYNRGVCKRMAAKETNYLSLYYDYHISAIADQDKAIALDPGYGNAYLERAFDYMNLTESLDYTADEEVVLSIAMENLQAALALDTQHPSAQVNRVSLPIQMGRCQEGLQEGYRQIGTTPKGEAEAILYDTLARGHLCLGEYEKALSFIEKASAIKPQSGSFCINISILIALGKFDEAFEKLDQCIQQKPTYGGYRYYQRALIFYERGEFELAYEDLDTGSGNTWYHGGLYAYVMGVLARQDGNQDEAKEWLIYAADSVMPHEGLWLKKRIHAELAKLNVDYMKRTPEVFWNVTPIPPHPAAP